VLPRRDIPALHALRWGVLPPMALILAALVFAGSYVLRTFGAQQGEFRPVARADPGFTNPARVRQIVLGLAVLVTLGAAALTWQVHKRWFARTAPKR
jgi:hypothetical protein